MSDSLCWLTQDFTDVPDKDDWLGEEECRILSGLRFVKRRNDWRLGRWTAKQAVHRYQLKSNSALATIEIRAAGDGAPEVFQSNNPENICLSISHSNARGFCVVGPSDFAVGCDLESLEEREEALIHDYFAPEEISYCLKAAAEEKILVVNRIWSAKESILKALREGLRRDTRSVIVHPDFQKAEGEWNPWTGRCLESMRIFYGWWRAETGYIMTMVSDRPTSIPKRLPLSA
jgi:4'-phosphopantetheinyl transferase